MLLLYNYLVMYLINKYENGIVLMFYIKINGLNYKIMMHLWLYNIIYEYSYDENVFNEDRKNFDCI